LVILQSYLNEGLGPSLYVAPDKYLVKQVLKEAERLGIDTVVNPDDSRYLAGEAIAVVNAYKLFNGRTVFSDRRTSSRPCL
jgi:replicative superfamily II helicase